MKRSACLALITVGLVLVIAAVLVVWFGVAPEAESAVAPTARSSSISKKSARSSSASKKSVRSKPKLNVRRSVVDDSDDEDDDRTPAEKALADRIERALDSENVNEARGCAEEAQACRVTEIRQSMVDTLGWFGKATLPEMTPFLVDADEDVRESAQNEWSVAIAEIEDDAERISMVEMAMKVLKDEDFLEDISGEYIGIDEKIAVESLIRIIGSAGSEAGIAKAKETYEFVTGEEWQDADAASRWLAEEYEPVDQ